VDQQHHLRLRGHNDSIENEVCLPDLWSLPVFARRFCGNSLDQADFSVAGGHPPSVDGSTCSGRKRRLLISDQAVQFRERGPHFTTGLPQAQRAIVSKVVHPAIESGQQVIAVSVIPGNAAIHSLSCELVSKPANSPSIRERHGLSSPAPESAGTQQLALHRACAIRGDIKMAGGRREDRPGGSIVRSLRKRIGAGVDYSLAVRFLAMTTRFPREL